MKWKRRRFDQLADFRNGLNFGADQRGGDLAVLGVGDFGQSVLRSSDHLETVSVPDGAGGVSELAEGDLVFVRSNGSRDLVGRCMYVERLSRRTSHSGFTIRARARSAELNPKWAVAFFQSGLADRALGRGSPGTNISNITQGILGGVELPVPPKPVQDHLVRVLNGVDQRSDELEELLKIKRAFKRALMNDLLTGQRRFPEYANRPLRVVSTREMAELVRDQFVPDASSAQRACIELEHIEGGTGRILGTTLTTQESSSKCSFEVGDVLYGRLRPYLRKFACPSFAGVCSSEILVLRPREGVITTDWLLGLVQTEVFARAAAITSGSKMPRADWRTLGGTSGFLPEIDEQQRIGELMRGMDRELEHLISLSEHVEVLKRGLMQRLLSGDVAIPEHVIAGSSAAEATDDDS